MNVAAHGAQPVPPADLDSSGVVVSVVISPQPCGGDCGPLSVTGADGAGSLVLAGVVLLGAGVAAALGDRARRRMRRL